MSGPEAGGQGQRVRATRDGRWGVNQFNRFGEPTGGGTIGIGWATREEAERNNPPYHGYTFVPFERWSEGATTFCPTCPVEVPVGTYRQHVAECTKQAWS